LKKKGWIRIPRKIREAAQLTGNCVNIKAEGRTIIIEAQESIADKHYGAFKVEKWPADLHEYAHAEMRKDGDNALLHGCQCFRLPAR
jgi:hypothetical protein